MSRISSKITVLYVLSFIVGALLLFLLTGYILHSSLKSKDKDLLEAKFQEYSLLLKKDGVGGLQHRVSRQTMPDASSFLVRYQSASGKTLFLHVPKSMEIVGWTITLSELDQYLKENANSGQWFEIPGPEYGDDVEVLSKQLSNGSILQIGKDTEDREEFLKQFIKSFFIGFFPIASISFVTGYFFSRKILRPIRWLTETIKEVQSGKSGPRVPLSGNKDELDQLGSLFNQMQDQNENLVRGMKETLDHVAHDLRTPIMRMQNASHSILQKMAKDNISSPFQDALIECQENSETILKMLDAIMDVMEVETGTMYLNIERLSLRSLIDNILDIYKFIGEEKNIQIVNEVSSSILIDGDKGRLLQALANIIDNSIKYSPENSQAIVRGSLGHDSVILDIADEGMGISENEIPRIWDRLYRGDSSRSTKGLGLGLSFVFAIVEAHKGKISVHNNPDKGCTFRIHFPTTLSTPNRNVRSSVFPLL